MGMEEGGGDIKCFPRAWGIPAKPCDSCKLAAALVFCRVDSAFLCIACDLKTHGLGNTRHERVWMCEVCEQAPASVTCKADAAALCVTCDRDIHSANPLASRHERIPVAPFYDTAESVVKSAAASAGSLLFAGGDTTGIADQETAPVSWVIPDPTQKLPVDPTEMKSIDIFFSDTEQFLDFECPIGIHNSGTDSVVPIQPMKSVQQAAQEMINPLPDNYVENDFSSSKFNSYTNSSSYTAQSLSHSFSSSSMDVGVVPDGSCMSEISFPFGRITNNNVDLSVMVNTAPCQGSDRAARVLRYREKKKNRKFEKTIRYASRKAYAETRPRIKGRFAKRGETDSNMLNRSFLSGSRFLAESRFVVDVASYGIVPSFL